VVVVAGGRIIAQGSVDDIAAQAGLDRVNLRAIERASLEEAVLRLTGGAS
jgi:hypothetical protein